MGVPRAGKCKEKAKQGLVLSPSHLAAAASRRGDRWGVPAAGSRQLPAALGILTAQRTHLVMQEASPSARTP